MTETQKTMAFAAKSKKKKATTARKKPVSLKPKKSKLFPGLEYPTSVRPESLDAYLEYPATRIVKIEERTVTASVNTLEDVGVTTENFVPICVWINFRYENNGLADDHWCGTPRLEAAVWAINKKFGTFIQPFHYFQLQIAMRKFGDHTLSTYSFEKSKKGLIAEDE